MPAIQVKIIKGPLTGKSYTFMDKTACVVGRGEDCTLILPNDAAHKAVSRWHCLLDMNPALSQIKIKDFGSRNGTFVNGIQIGQRKIGQTAHEAVEFPSYTLVDGDEIQIGLTTLKISIYATRLELAEVAPAIGSNPDATPQAQMNSLLARARKGEAALAAFSAYKMVSELGEGARGTTFLANHYKTGQAVALRLLKPLRQVSGQALESCLQALKSAVVLNHPHIAKTYAYAYIDGLLLIASEFCDAGNLEQLFHRRGGKIPLSEALPIALQLLEALQYAHQFKLPQMQFGTQEPAFVHYDLHPRTVLLAYTAVGQYSVKIGAYGLKHALDLAGINVQTTGQQNTDVAPYVPRQRLVEFNYRATDADVWAVAALLYHMVAGVPPRDLANARDPWQAILLKPVIPLQQRLPDCPPLVARVIDRALQETSGLTYQKAVEFSMVLRTLL